MKRYEFFVCHSCGREVFAGYPFHKVKLKTERKHVCMHPQCFVYYRGQYPDNVVYSEEVRP